MKDDDDGTTIEVKNATERDERIARDAIKAWERVQSQPDGCGILLLLGVLIFCLPFAGVFLIGTYWILSKFWNWLF